MRGVAVVLFCVAVAVAVIDAYPQFYERQSSDPLDDVEEIDVAPYGRGSRVPTFVVDPTRDILPPGFTRGSFNPFGNDSPFESFMTRLQETLTALRERMERFPAVPQNGTIFEFGDGPVQNKTTSTTKIVDGHVVTVNETTYSTGSDGNSAVFHFEIVEVKPKHTEVEERIPEDTETTNAPVTSTTTTTTTEANAGKTEENNEIPKDKVSFSEWDSYEAPSDQDLWHNEVDSDTFNEFDDVSVFEPERVVDLSGDILVNKLVSEQAKGQGLFMMDPDAELINTGNRNEIRKEYFQYNPTEEEVLRI